MSVPWHQLETSDVLENLNTNLTKGLSASSVEERLESHGHNRLHEDNQRTLFDKIFSQFKSPLVYILVAAGVFTLLLGEYLDTIVITVALLINVIVGTFQEERASKAFEKLKAGQVTQAIVLRDGAKQNHLLDDLVPGDVVLLEAGFAVPADVRIFEAKDLKINEAVLTGEWLEVTKKPGTVPSDTSLAERFNMAWMGTLVVSGTAKGVVVETGSGTQVGEIAEALGSIDESMTPLQEKLQGVAQFLTRVIVVLVSVIFVLGLLRGEPFQEMVLIAVAVAVATVPSGLPTAVTVVLAIGMEAILRRGGLVKNLLAAETLGSTTIILTDKTGTLTQAKMKVAEIHTYESLGTQDPSEAWTPSDIFLLECANHASDAFIEEKDDAPQKLTVHGKPVEKAITLAALEAGISEQRQAETETRIDYLPFSSDRRFAAALLSIAGKHDNRVCLAGAPELLLEHSTHLYKEGRKIAFHQNVKAEFMERIDDYTSQGMRLIGVSYQDVSWQELPEADDIQGIPDNATFLGFVVLNDPLRADVAESIAEVQGAGARVIMITGDTIGTARSIAKEAGIFKEGDLAMRGDELDQIEDEDLYNMLMNDIAVIARATPKQKLRIATLLRGRGEVVAMTGDGVNDAPALRAASIGVAVGSGTEVAKEAADLVLINDSFSIMTAAIEEGRRIIDNLKKIIAYLLASSFSEIFVIKGALLLGAPLPLLPSQILWAKIVEEGLMSFSFAFEKQDPNAMKRDPRSAVAKDILTSRLRTLIIIVSATSGLLSVALYFFLLYWLKVPLDEVRTMMFVTISLDAIFIAFSLKSLDTPLWRINPFTNTYLVVALAASVGSLLLALTFDPLQRLLTLSDLKAFEVAILFGVGFVNLTTIELAKYFLFERLTRRS